MIPPRRRAYLDHNATSPMRAPAREATARALDPGSGVLGNPSSAHGPGHQARLVLEKARADVARLVHGEASGVTFVSGGTESDNLAVVGVARAWMAAGRSPGRIVTSAVEHPAVLESCRQLSSLGWALAVVPVDGTGRVDPGDVARAIEADTALVSVMAANNETGVLQPIEEIARAAREAGVPLHVDAVQAAGRIPIDVSATGIDLLSISAHKIGGPPGIGALWAREGLPIGAMIVGGGQERRRRAGTQAPALAAGFAAAAAATPPDEPSRLAAMRDAFEDALRRALGAGGLASRPRVNGGEAPRLPNTSSIVLPGLDAEAVVIRMDMLGFAISTGAACSTGAARPSHVLAAMGLPPEEIAATVRVSFGWTNDADDAVAAAEALAAVTADLLRGAPATGGSAVR